MVDAKPLTSACYGMLSLSNIFPFIFGLFVEQNYVQLDKNSLA